MNPELTPSEPAAPPSGSSALGALLVVSSLLVACGVYTYADQLRPSARQAAQPEEPAELPDSRACTRATRLPAEFVA